MSSLTYALSGWETFERFSLFILGLEFSMFDTTYTYLMVPINPSYQTLICLFPNKENRSNVSSQERVLTVFVLFFCVLCLWPFHEFTTPLSVVCKSALSFWAAFERFFLLLLRTELLMLFCSIIFFFCV